MAISPLGEAATVFVIFIRLYQRFDVKHLVIMKDAQRKKKCKAVHVMANVIKKIFLRHIRLEPSSKKICKRLRNAHPGATKTGGGMLLLGDENRL